MKDFKYLVRNRLSDIIALIQILGLSNQDFYTNDQLNQELGESTSDKSWIDLIVKHFEIFKNVNGRIYLNSRFYTLNKLELKEVFDLIKFVNDMHDKELLQRNKNNHRIPIYVSLIATGLSLFSLFFNSSKANESIQSTIRNEFQAFKNAQRLSSFDSCTINK